MKAVIISDVIITPVDNRTTTSIYKNVVVVFFVFLSFRL